MSCDFTQADPKEMQWLFSIMKKMEACTFTRMHCEHQE